MSEIAMIADVHVEKNKNLPHVIECCKWVGDVLFERKIKKLFVLGDFINSRIKIDSLVLSSAIEILEYWSSKDIEVVLLLGNHELYYKENRLDESEVTSIKPFKKFCKVVEHYESIEVYNTIIHLMPWITDLKKYREVLESADVKKDDIIMSHTEVLGSVLNGISNIKDTSGLPSSMFKVKTFLGHYHKRQKFYIGSPLSLNFGEASEEKGITIFNCESKETEFIQNPKSEIYKTILFDDYKDDDNFENSYFIRILLTKKISENNKAQIIDHFNKINKQVIFKPIYSEESQETIEVKENSLLEMMREYIEKYSNDLDKEKLYDIGKDFYERKYSNVL